MIPSLCLEAKGHPGATHGAGEFGVLPRCGLPPPQGAKALGSYERVHGVEDVQEKLIYRVLCSKGKQPKTLIEVEMYIRDAIKGYVPESSEMDYPLRS